MYTGSWNTANFTVTDISSSTNPVVVKSVASGGTFSSNLFVAGRYLYVAGDSLSVFDIASASAPSLLSTVPNISWQSLFVSGRYLYVQDTPGNLLIYDLRGLETNALVAGSADLGQLFVSGNIVANSGLQVAGGLNVGGNGIYSSGGLGVMGNAIFASSSRVGIGTTTPSATLSVQSNGTTTPFRVASSTGQGLLTLDTAGNLVIKGSLTQNGSPDVAENVISADSAISGGSVVMINTANVSIRSSDEYNRFSVVRATSTGSVLGVISTSPGILINSDPNVASGTMLMPLALAGRVPVKVSNENGNIQLGDYLTVSKQFPGFAMKATASGQVIGQALEPFGDSASATSATGTVLTFVNLGWQNINNTFVLGLNDGQLVGQVGDSVSSSSGNAMSFLIDQQGSGNILQLQAGEQNRFLVASSGSISILANVASASQNILTVSNSSTTLFTISSVGDAAFVGHITVGRDTAGTAVIKAGDNATQITFTVPYLSVPKIIVTPADVPAVFAVTKKTLTGFAIVMDKTYSQDISFDWFVINQPGDTVSQSLNLVVSGGGAVSSSPPPSPPAQSPSSPPADSGTSSSTPQDISQDPPPVDPSAPVVGATDPSATTVDPAAATVSQ